MTGRFPFGRPSGRRPPRLPASSAAELFVLGVYPSALHARWQRPDGEVIGALAVDDEPTVFWDGADARDRIDAWRTDIGWRDRWGALGMAGGNGSSGRIVVDEVLAPLGVRAEATFFTDCLPFYCVKRGAGSQGARIAQLYDPFAREVGLDVADLPRRPPAQVLVKRTLAEEAEHLSGQLYDAGAPRVVTLGQEAADVFAGLVRLERMRLTPDPDYGAPVSVRFGGRRLQWIPLTHPGNRTPAWRLRHRQWMEAGAAEH